MNIRMEYLYRDAGNYKSWGAVVVANPPDPLSVDEIEAAARAALIDGGWFVASAAGPPDDIRGRTNNATSQACRVLELLL